MTRQTYTICNVGEARVWPDREKQKRSADCVLAADWSGAKCISDYRVFPETFKHWFISWFFKSLISWAEKESELNCFAIESRCFISVALIRLTFEIEKRSAALSRSFLFWSEGRSLLFRFLLENSKVFNRVDVKVVICYVELRDSESSHPKFSNRFLFYPNTFLCIPKHPKASFRISPKSTPSKTTTNSSYN